MGGRGDRVSEFCWTKNPNLKKNGHGGMGERVSEFF